MKVYLTQNASNVGVKKLYALTNPSLKLFLFVLIIYILTGLTGPKINSLL